METRAPHVTPLRWMMMAIMTIAAASAQAQQSPAVKSPSPGAKFFPLSGRGALKSDSGIGLRSDQKTIRSGFMRIDRGSSKMTSDSRSTQAPAAEAEATKLVDQVVASTEEQAKLPNGPTGMESEEIAGNTERYNPSPVLSLFDTESAAPLRSFSDAMHGTFNGISPLTRHPVWPVPLRFKQYVSSGYGMRSDPFTHAQAFHGGIDIVADAGTTVVASADGVVTAVSADANYGKYIAIQHNDGTTSRYGHLSAQTVAQGQSVHAGQAIGAVGATGRATGPHLDFRVSKNNIKYDPLTVLTIPKEVALNDENKVRITSPFSSGSKVASNALPKHPMVIQVR